MHSAVHRLFSIVLVILCYIKLLRNIIDRLGAPVCEFLLAPFVVTKGRSVLMLSLICRRLGHAHTSHTSAGRRSGGGGGENWDGVLC